MIILALRTDQPQAELYIYDNQARLAEIKWQARRELAETIHLKVKKILDMSSISNDKLEGIVVYKGPGSFTGLRIGMSVANALSYAKTIPIVTKGGQDWLAAGIKDLQAGQNDKLALPEYGAPAHTTKPLK